MKHVIAIVGPTACGKTALSIEMAKKLDTEIVAMDSMQIYKYMDIGTAKPTVDEMSGIKHHMLDVVSPFDAYSVAQYRSGALSCIEDIHKKGKIPILVGGTGLYLKALLSDLHLGHTIGNDEIRAHYEHMAKTEGAQKVHALLSHVDPGAAQRLHPNDLRRVIRALEVFEVTGERLSERPQSAPQSNYHFIILGLHTVRERLIERINLRVAQMMDAGLAEEVKALLDRGVRPDAQAMQGIGYKELVPCFTQGVPLSAAQEAIKIRTRQYAKRQMTWFRATPDVNWLNTDDGLLLEKAFKYIP